MATLHGLTAAHTGGQSPMPAACHPICVEFYSKIKAMRRGGAAGNGPAAIPAGH
jgi:hypothetical protein